MKETNRDDTKQNSGPITNISCSLLFLHTMFQKEMSAIFTAPIICLFQPSPLAPSPGSHPT